MTIKFLLMNKDMKILIIGFGSIGQRHYRNLKKLGYKNLYIYDPNKKVVSRQPARNALHSKAGGSLVVSQLNFKSLKDFDITFINGIRNQLL